MKESTSKIQKLEKHLATSILQSLSCFKELEEALNNYKIFFSLSFVVSICLLDFANMVWISHLFDF